MRVWIEIQYIRDNKKVPKFHPLMRVWIEIPWWTTFKRMKATVSPSYEGVDWNTIDMEEVIMEEVSPSYEGVDWNTK